MIKGEDGLYSMFVMHLVEHCGIQCYQTNGEVLHAAMSKTGLLTGAEAERFGTLVGVLAVLRSRRRASEQEGDAEITTRGPLTHTGPSSLGGTELALPRR